ncbi:MAG: hypothetical protein LUG26_05065 [Ruminococcus sp.]|nr:hypothetical protein [Ruminococcus sp.]
MRLISMICAAVLAAASLTGCDSGRIYNKNYVRAAAVWGDTGSEAVIAFYDEEGIYSASGRDLQEIIRNTEIGVGKSVFTGHTELIILGECDYAETLTFLLNEWRVSPSCQVVYGGESAADVLEKLDAEALADSVSQAVEQGRAAPCDIVTVLGGLLSESGAAEVAKVSENGFSGTAYITRK